MSGGSSKSADVHLYVEVFLDFRILLCVMIPLGGDVVLHHVASSHGCALDTRVKTGI